MEFKGTVIHEEVVEIGDHTKQTVVIDTGSEYKNQKHLALDVWNDKIKEFDIYTGAVIEGECNVGSREHDGKWYTSVNIWKCEKTGGSKTMVVDETPPIQDDLPF